MSEHTEVFISHMEKVYRNRLASWEEELETNEHKMAHLAERSIKVLKAEIKRLFGDD